MPRQAVLFGLVICGFSATAWAYDFSIDLRTIGQGYQVRGFAPDGSNELLSRRRLTQYMDLSVSDIGSDAWHGDDGDRNLVTFEASLRFDSDFGGYLLGAPGGAADIISRVTSPYTRPSAPRLSSTERDTPALCRSPRSRPNG